MEAKNGVRSNKSLLCTLMGPAASYSPSFGTKRLLAKFEEKLRNAKPTVPLNMSFSSGSGARTTPLYTFAQTQGQPLPGWVDGDTFHHADRPSPHMQEKNNKHRPYPTTETEGTLQRQLANKKIYHELPPAQHHSTPLGSISQKRPSTKNRPTPPPP